MNVVPLCTGQADCGCWVMSRQVRRIPTRRLEPDQRLLPVDLCSFRNMVIKSREMLPDPIIPEEGLVMVYGYRGTGKTHVGLVSGLLFRPVGGSQNGRRSNRARFS
jgi:hypothetical protein